MGRLVGPRRPAQAGVVEGIDRVLPDARSSAKVVEFTDVAGNVVIGMVPEIAYLAIGAGLDHWLHTTWMSLAGLVLGIVAGFYQFIRTAMSEEFKD